LAVWITNWCFVNDKRHLKDFCDALLQNKIYLKMIEIRGDFFGDFIINGMLFIPVDGTAYERL